MKLQAVNHKAGYIFDLCFSDASHAEVDLAPLLQQYLEPDDLATASIDPEWGCLTFKDGMIDIEPKTLYKFATTSP